MTDERGGRYFREARFFLAGDTVAAQSHILEARSLMGYMRDMQAMGGPPIQVKYATLQDGTRIKATMMNGQYQAEIISPTPSTKKRKTGLGEIICLPYDDTDAPSGWGAPFTFDADGIATGGTPGGANPYVIFSAYKAVRQPNIPTEFPLLVGLDTTDPLYQRYFWVNADYTDVFSWFSTGLYHRGKIIANIGTQLQTIINSGGYSFTLDDVYNGSLINAAARNGESNRLLISASWNLLLPDLVTRVIGTVILYYTLGGTPGAETTTYQANVWQTNTSYASYDEAVFNQAGGALNITYTEVQPSVINFTADVVSLVWNGAAFVATAVNYFLSAVGSTAYPRPLARPCWRNGDAATLWAAAANARGNFTGIYSKKLASGAETVITPNGPSDVALIKFDAWQHRHVIADVDLSLGTFNLSYIDKDGSFNWIGSGYLTTEAGPTFEGYCRICVGSFARVVHAVFGKNTMLCAIQGAGLRYFNGELMTDGSSVLGVARTDNALYSICPTLTSNPIKYKLGLI